MSVDNPNCASPDQQFPISLTRGSFPYWMSAPYSRLGLGPSVGLNPWAMPLVPLSPLHSFTMTTDTEHLWRITVVLQCNIRRYYGLNATPYERHVTLQGTQEYVKVLLLGLYARICALLSLQPMNRCSLTWLHSTPLYWECILIDNHFLLLSEDYSSLQLPW